VQRLLQNKPIFVLSFEENNQQDGFKLNKKQIDFNGIGLYQFRVTKSAFCCSSNVFISGLPHH